ncbi:MAG: hypothetical protein Q4A74_09600, partial [Cardiobacteriaceae bacterium]|nr:hypothetical protein [Cardiobacteriaceae bacterium]
MSGNGARAVFSYGLNQTATIAGLTGQAVSISTEHQSVRATVFGASSVAAGYAEGVADVVSWSEKGVGYQGRLSGTGSLLGLAQVGVSLAENGGDGTKLTAGDLLNVAGALATFIPGGQVIGAAIAVGGAVYSIYESKYGSITVADIGNAWGNWLSGATDFQGNVNRDGKFHTYDPLVLDLDGDGIETVSANHYKGALFDHNKSGIRTATGWVSADDGLLVVDRNGDGIINNGNELFGGNTTLIDGSNAANGYTALAEFDNNSDGVIDEKDKDFNKLRIWRDLNQDGVSQKEELFTLDAVNVKSLNVAHQDVSKNLGGGNILAQKGSYSTVDGKLQKMGDLLLSHNSLYSRYTDSVPLTNEQLQAANMAGIDRLRDLREAAALSKDLAADLKAYSQAETKAEQRVLLGSLIDQWARTDPLYGNGVKFLPPALRTANEGVAVTPRQANALKVLQIPQEYLDKVNQVLNKIAVLDAFSGEKSNTIYVTSAQEVLNFYEVVNKAYDKLAENIYEGLLFQTRLKPYLNKLGFIIENNEFKLDYSGVIAAFEEIHAKNPEKAFVDLGEFITYSKNNSDQDMLKFSTVLVKYIDDAVQNGTLEQYKTSLGE